MTAACRSCSSRNGEQLTSATLRFDRDARRSKPERSTRETSSRSSVRWRPSASICSDASDSSCVQAPTIWPSSFKTAGMSGVSVVEIRNISVIGLDLRLPFRGGAELGKDVFERDSMVTFEIIRKGICTRRAKCVNPRVEHPVLVPRKGRKFVANLRKIDPITKNQLDS